MSDRVKVGVAPTTATVNIKTRSAAFHLAEWYAAILKSPVLALELAKAASSERWIFSHEQVGKPLDTLGYKDE